MSLLLADIADVTSPRADHRLIAKKQLLKRQRFSDEIAHDEAAGPGLKVTKTSYFLPTVLQSLNNKRLSARKRGPSDGRKRPHYDPYGRHKHDWRGPQGPKRPPFGEHPAPSLCTEETGGAGS